jgi:SAM-dependent methyltransferase
MGRYQAFLTAEGYANANAAFRRYWSGDRPELLRFIDQRLPVSHTIGNDFAILSVGSGTGEFDEALIQHICSRPGSTGGTLRYVAVEPNPAQAEQFAARLQANEIADVVLELVPMRAEEYRSETLFDLIHYTHSIYHIAGQEEAVLRDAVRMLKHHGQLSRLPWRKAGSTGQCDSSGT